MFLVTKWSLKQDVYELLELKNQENGQILQLDDLFFADNKYYVDNLDRFSIYLLNFLLCKGFKNASNLEELTKNTFFTNANGSGCASFFVFKDSKISFYNFARKFGLDFGTFEQNQLLLDYADKNNRNLASLGADAYNEFLHTLFRPKQDPNANKKLMREDYPIINNKILTRAKAYCAGFQFYKKGYYTHVYNYDQASAFPSQLLNRTPTGAPKTGFKSLESVPDSYWYCVDIVYFDLKPKIGYDWLKIDQLPSHGHLYLTKELYKLFSETYTSKHRVVDIIAFKTIRNRFNVFVDKNVIQGKLNCKNRAIAKYNKYIANSLIGYCGRNIDVKTSIFHYKNNKFAVKIKNTKIDPVYLPLYLYVNGKQKSEFIKTLNQTKGIIYANTDGFITDRPQNMTILNARFTDELGAFKYKCEYEELQIETINGYVGITTTGEIDNTLAGMTMHDLITPEQYAKKNYTYYVECITPDLRVARIAVNMNRGKA